MVTSLELKDVRTLQELQAIQGNKSLSPLAEKLMRKRGIIGTRRSTMTTNPKKYPADRRGGKNAIAHAKKRDSRIQGTLRSRKRLEEK